MADVKKEKFRKEGVLNKKGMGTFYRPWAERNFVLSADHRLAYFDPQKNVQRGNLKIHGGKVRRVEPGEADGRRFAFELYNLEAKKKSSLIMQASSDEEVDAWMNCLNAALESAEKNSSKHTDAKKETTKGVTATFEVLSNPEAMKMVSTVIPGLLSVAGRVPLIGVVADTLSKFYNTCETVATNSKELLTLRDRITTSCNWTNELCEEIEKDDAKREAFEANATINEALPRLQEALKNSVDLIERLSSRLEPEVSGGWSAFSSGLKNLVVASADEKELSDIRTSLNEALKDLILAKANFMQELSYKIAIENRASTASGGASGANFNEIEDISEAFYVVDLTKEAEVLACLRKVYTLTGGDDCDTEDEDTWDQIQEAQNFEQIEPMLRRYQHNAEVVTQALKVIANLAESSDNSASLGLIGTCEAVLSSMKANSKNKDLLAAGLGAVFKLAEDDSDNSDTFLEGGICKIVYKAVLTNSDHEAIVEK